MILDAIGDAQRICNIGAGTGSYEPLDREVVAVEPSLTMIRQRFQKSNVVRAVAEQLPFQDQTFDVALAILTVHHWDHPEAGLHEMIRVARRQVVLTLDPEQVDKHWLVRDYLPELGELEQSRAFPITSFCRELDTIDVRIVTITEDCRDGFEGAYWKRPAMYLDPSVRASMSSFSMLPARRVDDALERLRRDLKDGTWQRKHRDLLDKREIDLGYRLIVAENSVS